MSSFVFPALMAATVLCVTACLLIAPRLAPDGIVLGARVPRSRADSPAVTGALRTYRVVVAATGLLLAVAVVLFSHIVWVVVLAPLVLTLAAGVTFALQHSRIAAAKREENWFDDVETAITGRVAGTGDEQRAFPWATFAAALAVPVIGGLYTLARWEDIPEVFPVHFGPDLQPDAWGDKTAGTVLFGMWFALGLVAVMAVVARLTVSQRTHVRSDRSAAGRRSQSAVLHESVHALAWVSLVVALGLTIMQIAAVIPEYQPHMPVLIVAFFAAVLGAIGVMIARISWVRTRARGEQEIEGAPESPDNDRHYTWGMFYHNPDDPAVLVDKRAGVGVDFNYATWQAKAFVAAIALIVIGAVALPFML
ncbi:DUF1648 domain-containing protein [Corynebacterium sp.]|uniref:DUF1648 domain-containing protein n=1 Tax=Corynebacterium sp. TaxID=1720 RepID=UPI002A91307F|nr:DUF5808 domain-containing protein [Corynebacterium sp.]MDY5785232.1 DUF1648 domain-containing protein [Corynebacterium sp.]